MPSRGVGTDRQFRIHPIACCASDENLTAVNVCTAANGGHRVLVGMAAVSSRSEPLIICAASDEVLEFFQKAALRFRRSMGVVSNDEGILREVDPNEKGFLPAVTRFAEDHILT